MPDFNADDYFNQRLGNEYLPESPGQIKLSSLEQASNEKVKGLEEFRQQLIARQKALPNTLVGKLGLEPGSYIANKVNEVANLTSGVSQVEGQLMSSPFNALASVGEASITKDEFAAYARHSKGEATPEDSALLSRRMAQPKTEQTPFSVTVDNPVTVQEQIERAIRNRNRAQTIIKTLDQSALVQQDNRDKVNQVLGNAFDENKDAASKGWEALGNQDAKGVWEATKGIAGMLAGIGEAVWKSPTGVVEYITENLPQVGLGLLGGPGKMLMGASISGYAADNYAEGLRNYQKDHNGAFPPDDVRTDMALKASTLALSEFAADMTQIGAVSKPFNDAVRTGFKESLLRAGKATAEGVASEAPTEAYQTYMEGEVKQRPVSGKDIYLGGAIGGLVGSGFAGGGRAISEIAKATPEHEAKRIEEAKSSTTYQDAVKANDPSPYLDTKNPKTYDPVKAVGVYFDNSQLESTTLEAKQENLKKSTQVVETLEKQVDLAKQDLETRTPEALETYKRNLATETERLKTAKPEEIPEIQDNISGLKEIITGFPEHAKQAKAVETRLQRLTKQLESTQEVVDRLRSDISPKTTSDEFSALVEQANVPVGESSSESAKTSSEAINRVINLSMASSGHVTPEVATLLANNEKNALTPSQRDYLRKFSEARQAQNQFQDLGGVQQDILLGNKETGQIGIADYQKRMSLAIATQNQQAAEKQLISLGKFAQSHTGKLQAIKKAQSQFRDTGIPVQVYKSSQGNWDIATTPIPDADLQAGGGVTIKEDSSKLIKAVEQESQLLTKALDSLQSAYDLTFTKKNSTKEESSKTSLTVPTKEQDASSITKTTKEDSDITNNNKESSAPITTIDKSSSTNKDNKDTTSNNTSSNSIDIGMGLERTTVGEKQYKKDSTPKEEAKANSDEETTSETPSQEFSDEAMDELKSLVSKAGLTTDETPESTGALSVYGEKSTEAKPFQERNLIADYTTQEATRGGDTTSRPLVQVKNFLSALKEGYVSVLDYVTTRDGKVSENQERVLNLFMDKAFAWQQEIKDLLVLPEEKQWWFKNPVHYLTQKIEGKDGNTFTMDENTLTAIAFGVFSYAAEKASGLSYNTDAEINAITGADEDAVPSTFARQTLRYVGTRENVVANTIGQRIVQALGLKATEDAPQDLLPRLEATLGELAIQLMLDKGLVERHTVSAEDMATLMGKRGKNTVKGAEHKFIRLAYQERTEGSTKAELQEVVGEIYRANKETQNFINDLFKAEGGLRAPTLKPVTQVHRTIRNSTQEIPTELQAYVKEANAREYRIREDWWHLLNTLDSEVALEMAGKVTDLETKHNHNKLGAEATNEGLALDYDHFLEFGDSLPELSTPFYFEHSVKSQQRVHIDSNMVNPQGSKLQRHLVYQTAWETQIDTADSEAMESFRLRVAEGLGIKTERMPKDAALALLAEAFNTEAANPKVQENAKVLTKAVDILANTVLSGNPLTPTMQQDLLNAVKLGGNNYHSMDVLLALAHQKYAKDLGKATFTSQIMGEVDGVTNGPMLAHLLLGAGQDIRSMFDFAHMGGFYEANGNYTQFSEFISKPGNKDLYERTIDGVLQQLTSYFASSGDPTLRAIYGVTGELYSSKNEVTSSGRNIIKKPLTSMVFGASLKNTREAMADTFVESVYDRLEKFVGKPQHELDTFIAQLNYLFKTGGATSGIAPGTEIHTLMASLLTPEQSRALWTVFDATIGATVEETMDTHFGTFLDRRSELNTTAQVAFSLYNAAYTAAREEYIKDLIAKGEIAADKAGNPYHDLSRKQENALRERFKSMAPVVHTPMSKQSNQPQAGLAAWKQEREISQNPIYQSAMKFGKAVGGKIGGITPRAMASVMNNPGVRMAVTLIHSLDSAISHRAGKGQAILNIHDAHGAGVADTAEASQRLNQATWETMLEYSPMSETHDALMRTLQGIEIMARSGNLPDSVKQSLVKEILQRAKEQKIAPEILLRAMASRSKLMAYSADVIKLDSMATMAYLDQYAGSPYEVSDADRAKAQAKRSKLEKDLSKQELATLAAIETALASTLKEASKPAAPKVKSEVVRRETPVGTSPFGKLGKPTIAPNPYLEVVFTKEPVLNARRAIRAVSNALAREKGTQAHTAFTKKLLATLDKLIDKDLNVHYVTAKTLPSEVLEQNKPGAIGWYVNKDGQHAIYILGTDFVDSNLSAELLVHELTHGVLAQIIANPTPESQPFIAELEALLQTAREFDKKGEFAHALTDVQELVSWGMTNKAFQDKVLKEISIESSTGSRLRDGLQSFVKALVGLLFKGTTRSEQTVNTSGLTALITNVAGLFDQASQTKTSIHINTSMVGTVQDLSTLDVLDSLDTGNTSPGFKTQLQDLLSGIVQNLHGPFGAFKASLQQGQALSEPAAPFSSGIIASGFQISEQETFVAEQVEATMRAAIEDSSITTRAAYKELVKLYQESEKRLTVNDFLPLTKGDQQQAQALRDFIFDMHSGYGDRLDYLSRFAAMGLAHEGFNGLLKAPTEQKGKPVGNPSVIQRLRTLMESILSWFNDKATHTFEGQHADQKLTALVELLVGIEAKKKATLAQKQNETLARVEDFFDKGADAVRAGVVSAANSRVLKNSGNAFVKAGASLVSVTASNRLGLFMDGYNQLRDTYFKGLPGEITKTFNYIKGPLAQFQHLLRLATNRERQRKAMITDTAKFVLESFADQGKGIKKEAKAAIAAVFLRTNAHALLGPFTMVQIGKFLEGNAGLNTAIKDYEDKLTGYPDLQHYFIKASKALAWQMVTGEAKTQHTLLNVHNIANLSGTHKAGQLTAQQANQVKDTLAPLVSLYALSYAASKQKGQVSQILKEELARKDNGNGLEFVLLQHRELLAQSKERLFDGSDALATDGYLPEIYNPYTAIVAADEREGETLINKGWKKGGLVERDIHDPDHAVKHLYVLKDGGERAHTTGIISYTNDHSKGTSRRTDDTFIGNRNAKQVSYIAKKKQTAIQDMFKPDPAWHPKGVKENFMVPLFNSAGEVVNYRYMMKVITKDTLLERNNDFEKLLGTLAGRTFDKESSKVHNRKAIEAMYELYKDNYGQRAISYKEVGPHSKDPELREIYRLLPDDTKQAIKDIWGTEGMMVRNDLLDISFGYRKYSLSSIFEKDKTERVGMEKLFGSAVESLLETYAKTKGMSSDEAGKYAMRAGLKVRQAEDIWAGFVREAKDIIVVKTGLVLMGNIHSNNSLLVMYGVPMADIVRDQYVAWRAATAYQKDTTALYAAQNALATGYTQGNADNLKREVSRLKDAIARNPVTPMIEAGLMPTIVEDVAGEEDPYSYKSRLIRKTEKFTSTLNPRVVNVGKQLYMAKDTQMYQLLSHTTQLSDFVARYALHKHLTTRAKNPLTVEQANQKASEAFINYDIPMPRGMQYLDDMGVTYFTKYFLSIQRVLRDLVQEHPARVLMTLMGNNYLGFMPTVMDSTFFSRIGNNPIESGAFKLPAVLDDLATVKGALNIFR